MKAATSSVAMTKRPGNSVNSSAWRLEFVDIDAEFTDRDHLGQCHREPAAAHVVHGRDVTGVARADRGDFADHEVDRRGQRLGVEVRHVTTASTTSGRPARSPEREAVVRVRVASAHEHDVVAVTPRPTGRRRDE